MGLPWDIGPMCHPPPEDRKYFKIDGSFCSFRPDPEAPLFMQQIYCILYLMASLNKPQYFNNKTKFCLFICIIRCIWRTW